MLIKALDLEQIEQCANLVMETDIGLYYFPTYELLVKELIKSFYTDSMYVAYSEFDEKKIIAMLWFKKYGAFHSYPYLHIIAVRKTEQGSGVGKKMMDFFEKEILKDGKNISMQTKAFLLVNSENRKAIHMYESRGYELVTELKGLYRKRMTENLMMKKICKQI